MTAKSNPPKRTLVSNLCPGLQLDEREVQRLIEVLDSHGSFDAPAGELSVAFVDEQEIARIHGDFMDDPSATDVITFPGDPDIELAGEICVCPQVALEYARKESLDFSEELSLYLIHGYLHLCGFDDIEDADRSEMRVAEQQALDIARAAKALPSFQLR